jgi:hypothetical protein
VKVYLSSPYSAPTEKERLETVYAAIEAGRYLMALGHQPFVPVLSHWMDPQGDLFEYDRWIEWCLCWLPDCDALLVLGDSKGCSMEANLAWDLQLPVYHSLDEFDEVDTDE